jgi:hypothetical protein
MRQKHIIPLFFFILSLLGGCAGIDRVSEISPNFNAMVPTVIAVMPPMNETVDLDAPKPFVELIKKVLTSRGYVVADQGLIDSKLKEEGIHEAAQARTISDKELGESFRAQALLFTTVTSWDTVYLGVYASVTVGARFELVDAATSEVLWKVEDEEGEARLAVDGDSAEDAIALALQSYKPYAKTLVRKSFKKLPVGPNYVEPKKRVMKSGACVTP